MEILKYKYDFDAEKYKTFFLEYWTETDSNRLLYENVHYVRPCKESYEDIKSNRCSVYTLDGAVMVFEHNATLPEILIQCSMNGINIDFIDILAKKDDDNIGNSSIVRVIDTHKEDLTKILGDVTANRYYVAKNVDKGNLKYLIIDRFEQSQDVKFLNGKYDKLAVIAGFKNRKEALLYCEKHNGKH